MLKPNKTYLSSLVALLVLLLTTSARATIYFQTPILTLAPVPDLPASFGPGIPGDGIYGHLVEADPIDACTPISIPDLPPSTSSSTGNDTWVALISRTQGWTESPCTFDVKVRNAEAAGARAAIVYDDNYGGLVVMAKPEENPDPGIPSVFISQEAGLLMRELLIPNMTMVLIDSTDQKVWVPWLLVSIIGGLALVIIIVAIVTTHRRRPFRGRMGEIVGAVDGLSGRRQAVHVMTEADLEKLAIVIHTNDDNDEEEEETPHADNAKEVKDKRSTSTTKHTAGDTRRVCVICLENYQVNDKLRVLPCSHRYHKECIDQWLLTKKAICPVCKWDCQTGDAEETDSNSTVDVEAGRRASSPGADGQQQESMELRSRIRNFWEFAMNWGWDPERYDREQQQQRQSRSVSERSLLATAGSATVSESSASSSRETEMTTTSRAPTPDPDGTTRPAA